MLMVNVRGGGGSFSCQNSVQKAEQGLGVRGGPVFLLPGSDELLLWKAQAAIC